MPIALRCFEQELFHFKLMIWFGLIYDCAAVHSVSIWFSSIRLTTSLTDDDSIIGLSPICKLELTNFSSCSPIICSSISCGSKSAKPISVHHQFGQSHVSSLRVFAIGALVFTFPLPLNLNFSCSLFNHLGRCSVLVCLFATMAYLVMEQIELSTNWLAMCMSIVAWCGRTGVLWIPNETAIFTEQHFPLTQARLVRMRALTIR